MCFAFPIGHFISVTYPRRTGGKHFRMNHVNRNALAARNNEPRDKATYSPWPELIAASQTVQRYLSYIDIHFENTEDIH